MRIALLLSLFLSTNILSIAQCITSKGISTNPTAPINPEGGKLNRFDWRNLLYTINSENTSSPIDAPFTQSNNSLVNHFLSNRDNEPIDGWEMIKYDLGFNDDNVTPRVKVGTIFLVLYNKYKGILRVFLEGNRNGAYNGAEISVRFLSGLIQTSLLNMGSEIIALDQFKQDSLKSVSEYNNDQGRWYYADFPMAYDPCTCFYGSKLVITTYLISNSKIQLSGSMTGTIKALSDITNNTGTVSNNNLSFNAKGISNARRKAATSYKDISKFANDQFTAIDNEGKTNKEIRDAADATKNSINLFQGLIKSKSFLKVGLKAAPFIGTAVSFIDYFAGGGASGPQEVKVTPMAINATLDLKGTLVSTYKYNDITLSTPGSKDVIVDSDYPYYNETLGIFNLLETPKVYSTLSSYSTYVNGSDDYRDDATRTFQVAPIKYVLNPAAGFNASKVEIMASLEVDGVPTKFVPLSCIGTFSYSYYAGYVSQLNGVTNNQFHDIPESRVKLKLLINLERNDTNSNTQNVLLVMKYPIQYFSLPANSSFNQDYNTYQDNIILQNTTVSGTIGAWKNITIGQGVTFQTGSKLIAGEGVILQAGASLPANVTLTTALPNGCSGSYVAPVVADYSYCTTAPYKVVGRNLRAASEVAPIVVNSNHERVTTAFPNPTSGHVTFRYYIEEPTPVKLNLIDLTSKVVATPVDAYQELGPYEVEFDATNLPAGVYIYTLETNKGKETKRLIVIK